eukprot:5533747-Ditylum_brightwellii.AAC.1
MAKYYEVGTLEEWLQFIDTILQVIKGHDIMDSEAAYTLLESLLCGDALQVFQKQQAVLTQRESPAFTKYLVAVTEHVFPTKVCKIQKKYIQNIH